MYIILCITEGKFLLVNIKTNPSEYVTIMGYMKIVQVLYKGSLGLRGFVK